MSFAPVNQINSFANVQHTDLNCIICKEKFKQEDVALAHDGTTVPHAMHTICLDFWMESRTEETGLTCPICHIPITHVNGRSLDEIMLDDEEERQAHAANTQVQALQAQVEEAARIARLEALYAGAAAGDLARVTQLLQGEFTENQLGNAVYLATTNGHLNVVQAILPRGISLEYRDLAVPQAAEMNSFPILQALLDSGPISDEKRGDAVVEATKRGNLNAVHSLLAGGAVPSISREIAFLNASNTGRLDIMQALIGYGPISDESRRSALTNAANVGHLNITELLLAGPGITDEARGTAVVVAAARRNIDIVRALLLAGPISDENRNRAIRFLGDQLNPEANAILELLQGNPPADA